MIDGTSVLCRWIPGAIVIQAGLESGRDGDGDGDGDGGRPLAAALLLALFPVGC